MADADNAVSKKRAAGRELSRDNPGLDDEEEDTEMESGTFKRASDEVLATRRIVKVRRQTTTAAPSSNPFAGICLIPSTAVTNLTTAPPASELATSKSSTEEKGQDLGEQNSTEKGQDVGEKKSTENGAQDAGSAETTNEHGDEYVKNDEDTVTNETNVKSAEKTKESADEPCAGDEKTQTKDNITPTPVGAKYVADVEDAESENKKETVIENNDSSAEGSKFGSFQQLSSGQNAFTGITGTGFSSSLFSFGSNSSDGFAFGASSGSFSLPKADQNSLGFGLTTNGSSSLFGNKSPSTVSKSKGSSIPPMQEVPLETGEKNENAVFTADSVLFEFLDGSWKERGKGEIKVNVSSTGTGKARLVMRSKGNYRLILNANLFPDMKLTDMDKKGITFACVNSISEGNTGMSTIALKFKDASIVKEFRDVVTLHKGQAAAVLKTPENSPKASE